jgi:ANTAR domain-containing protein
VIPGPRPPKGRTRPSAGRDRGSDQVVPLRPAPALEVPDGTSEAHAPGPVSLTRTPRGWAVTSPAGVEDAADLVEGLSLADLVAEELGALVEPDRSARRSARGPSGTAEDAADPVDARVAELERTVAQLEHALAARVSTERAIGILAERHSISARAAFESLRGDARSQGRPVAQLAREVLDSLSGESAPSADQPAADGRPLPAPRARADGAPVVAADGRS